MDLTPYLTDTMKLIHSTTSISAIKQLIIIYELLYLNAKIKETFKSEDWDFTALQDINYYRRELYLYHAKEFEPKGLIETYNAKLLSLLNTIQVKHECVNIGKLDQ